MTFRTSLTTAGSRVLPRDQSLLSGRFVSVCRLNRPPTQTFRFCLTREWAPTRLTNWEPPPQCQNWTLMVRKDNSTKKGIDLITRVVWWESSTMKSKDRRLTSAVSALGSKRSTPTCCRATDWTQRRRTICPLLSFPYSKPRSATGEFRCPQKLTR